MEQEQKRPVPAEVAVHEEERQLHQHTGHQREDQGELLPDAVARLVVGAAQVERH